MQGEDSGLDPLQAYSLLKIGISAFGVGVGDLMIPIRLARQCPQCGNCLREFL